MEAAALCLLLLLNSLDCGCARVSLTVSPSRLQFLKYEKFSVSCEDEEEESFEWRVVKRMEDGEEVKYISSSYTVTAAFPSTDSGIYWCETALGDTSDSLNITVTDGSVILESPVLPVMEGDDVTLYCRSGTTLSNLTADFYKDGFLIGIGSTAGMTIHSVSKSDEGLYKCSMSDSGESPESWLAVTAESAGSDPPAAGRPVLALLCHIMVGTPYLLSTVILGLIYRDRSRAEQAREMRGTTDDIIMEIVM